MHILAIETTGPKCSVAIINKEEQVTELEHEGAFAHLQHLVPMIAELLERTQLTADDLTAIAVSQGPGSFTGIRIGVTTARALAQALNIPAVAVSTLESFAYRRPGVKGVICPLFDARRNQVYGAAYLRDEDGAVTEIVRGGAYMLDEYLTLLFAAAPPVGRKELVFCGDGAMLHRETVQDAASRAGLEAKTEDLVQQASSIAVLGLELYRQGRAVPYGLIEPNYMREAEAQRNLDLKRKTESQCE